MARSGCVPKPQCPKVEGKRIRLVSWLIGLRRTPQTSSHALHSDVCLCIQPPFRTGARTDVQLRVQLPLGTVFPFHPDVPEPVTRCINIRARGNGRCSKIMRGVDFPNHPPKLHALSASVVLPSGSPMSVADVAPVMRTRT